MRTDPRIELEIWCCVFECGYDYFRELRRVGIDCDNPYTSADDRDVCRAAWERLGFRYIRARTEPPFNPPRPWAWHAFGPPDGLGADEVVDFERRWPAHAPFVADAHLWEDA